MALYASLEQRLRNGQTYIASTPKVSVAIAGNLKASFQNPAGSNKNIFIYGLLAANDSGNFGYADVALNATTQLPASAGTITNQNFGSSNTSVALVKYGTGASAVSGGTALFTLPTPPTTDTLFSQELLMLPPGNILTVNIAFPILTNAMFRLYFWEE